MTVLSLRGAEGDSGVPTPDSSHPAVRPYKEKLMSRDLATATRVSQSRMTAARGRRGPPATPPKGLPHRLGWPKAKAPSGLPSTPPLAPSPSPLGPASESGGCPAASGVSS